MSSRFASPSLVHHEPMHHHYEASFGRDENNGRNDGRDEDRHDQISGAPSALTRMQKLQSTLEEKLGTN